jgi:hypothetical protein
MSTFRPVVILAILSGIVAILTVPWLVRRHPASIASLALGTDDAFAVSGLEPRENLVGGGALRWTRKNASFRFDSVGPGLVDIEIEARDHRTDVTVTANGAVIGSLRPGESHTAARIKLTGSSLMLETSTDGFEASGRTLGSQVVSIVVKPVNPPGPGGVPLALWAGIGLLLFLPMVVNAAAGLAPWPAVFPAAIFLALVLPGGLWRSRWLVECAALMTTGLLVSVFIAAKARGQRTVRSWLQVAVFVAVTVHGVIPPSPLIVQGDAQLHGNKLGEVARGNWFPVTRTDHKPPFEIPYGFSFYGLLTPLAGDGASNVPVVRRAAALFSALSAVALAMAIGRVSATLAAASLLLWTFAPVNIRTMGFGNLNNVFAQSIFVLALVAAVLIPKRVVRSLCVMFLVALSATAHLSAFIVLVTLVLAAALFASDRHSNAFKPVLAGVAVAGIYYLTFLPMIAAHIPRLMGERGGSRGVFDPWYLPSQILAGFGWPLIALIALSLLVRAARPVFPLARSLAVTGGLLALVALVSPVEVRYLLAVLPLAAVLGASPLDLGDPRAFPRQTLASLVNVPWLRTLGSERVAIPMSVALILVVVFKGFSILCGFLPLSGV